MIQRCLRILTVMGLWTCSAEEDNTSLPADRYSIATQNYAVLAEKALTYQADFDLDGWGSMLADDVQFLPLEATLPLRGKKAVLAYWANYRNRHPTRSLQLSEFNHIPFQSNRPLAIDRPPGVYVYTTCRSERLLPTGQSLTRPWVIHAHFNQGKLIDQLRFYSNNENRNHL